MKRSTILALQHEFRRRARAAGDNLAAEAAWHTAADLLADAAKQDAQAARRTTRSKNLGLRLTR
jgi:hypothetical protein